MEQEVGIRVHKEGRLGQQDSQSNDPDVLQMQNDADLSGFCGEVVLMPVSQYSSNMVQLSYLSSL